MLGIRPIASSKAAIFLRYTFDTKHHIICRYYRIVPSTRLLWKWCLRKCRCFRIDAPVSEAIDYNIWTKETYSLSTYDDRDLVPGKASEPSNWSVMLMFIFIYVWRTSFQSRFEFQSSWLQNKPGPMWTISKQFSLLLQASKMLKRWRMDIFNSLQ